MVSISELMSTLCMSFIWANEHFNLGMRIDVCFACLLKKILSPFFYRYEVHKITESVAILVVRLEPTTLRIQSTICIAIIAVEVSLVESCASAKFKRKWAQIKYDRGLNLHWTTSIQHTSDAPLLIIENDVALCESTQNCENLSRRSPAN